MSGRDGLIVRIKAGAVSPARPGDSGQLVGHGAGGLVVIRTGLYAQSPLLERTQWPARVLVASGTEQDSACAVDQQRADILVTALADSTEMSP